MTEKPTISDLERDALRHVLSSRLGRRFVWSLLAKCGLMRNCFTGDNNSTNFNAGRQSVAADLIVDMDALNSDAFQLMAKESKEDNAYVNGIHNPSGGNAGSGQPDEPDSIAAIESTG